MSKNVIAVVNDIFFSEKIRGTANHLNIPVLFVHDGIELFEQLTKNSPSKIIFDLNDKTADPLKLIEKLKRDKNYKIIPTIGYLRHIQTDIKNKALSLGCDQVMPKSEFTQNLPDILQKAF